MVTTSIFLFGSFVRGSGGGRLPFSSSSALTRSANSSGATLIMAAMLTVFCVLVFLKGLGFSGGDRAVAGRLRGAEKGLTALELLDHLAAGLTNLRQA